MHIPLDSRTKTTDAMFCEHIRTLDLNSRTYQTVEQLLDDLLQQTRDNNTLTALTLLIVESNSIEKEVIIDLVMIFLT